MFDKITGRLRPGQNVPDLIEVLDLEEWYLDLSDEQRQKLHQYSTAFGTSGEINTLEQSVSTTSQTAKDYLKGVGHTATSENDYEFAEMVLLSALEFEDG